MKKSCIPDDVKVDNFNISPSGELSLYLMLRTEIIPVFSEIMKELLS